jgi:hypothetical protein
MIYGLQVALQALPPAPKPAVAQPAECHPERAQRAEGRAPSGGEGCHPERSAQRGVEGPAPSGGEGCHPERSAQHGVEGPAPSGGEGCHPERSAQRGVEGPAVAPPTHIPISKQSLLYFLRSRHCATCNAELFPAAELTERPNPGAPPAVIEEARPALPAPNHSPDQAPAEIPALAAGTLPRLEAVAEQIRGFFAPLRTTGERRQRSPFGNGRQRRAAAKYGDSDPCRVRMTTGGRVLRLRMTGDGRLRSE